MWVYTSESPELKDQCEKGRQGKMKPEIRVRWVAIKTTQVEESH